MPCAGNLPHGPARDEQTRGRNRFGVSQSAEGCTPQLLVGLSGARDHRTRELRRETLREPSLRQQMQVAPRHVDDASCVFERGQWRLVVRLRVMTSGEDDVRRAVAAGERAADGCGGSEGSGNSGNDLERHACFG